MTEMVTSGSMSGEGKRNDGLLGESDPERTPLVSGAAGPVRHRAFPRLYQQSVDGGPRGRRRPVLHRRAGPRTTRLVEGAGGAGARLSQSSAHARSTRAPIDAPTRRADRTLVRPSLRHRWHAADASARASEHSQAVADSRRWLQSRTA